MEGGYSTQSDVDNVTKNTTDVDSQHTSGSAQSHHNDYYKLYKSGRSRIELTHTHITLSVLSPRKKGEK